MLPAENNTTNTLLLHSTRQIPGAVQYTIERFQKPIQELQEERGMLHYQYSKSAGAENYLELRFCLAGNMYCKQAVDECKQCKLHQAVNCTEKVESVNVLRFVYSATLLSQLVKAKGTTDTLTEDVLTFKHTTSFTKIIPLCNRTRAVLEGLLNHSYTDTLENIYVNAQTQMLLLYSLDCMLGEKEIDTISCKFLANDLDREKIIKAREILIAHIGEPITIKELSRKVAINECYLKKGFKELFGTTIFEFYQSQRMEHAKYLLYEKGLSVTDVSALLGYSSISHFSTAFKKHTGLKPCELLFR
ncbi:MAG TPA: AraC family transcriptional regulator [Chitinophagaceae bacterium]|nr:AraC family transcriptional regulator [Chitinophagaceae bacterium]